MIINKEGYLARKKNGFNHAVSAKNHKKGNVKKNYRDWWFVKHTHNGDKGIVQSNTSFEVMIPKELLGKRIRFKLEVLDE